MVALENKMTRKKRVYRFLQMGCILMFLVCYLGYLWIEQEEAEAGQVYQKATFNRANQQGLERQGKRQSDVVQWWELQKEQYPDLIGWIQGKGLDYPIVQGEDNEFYLHHLADQTPNIMGAIFLDARDTSDLDGDIMVIYGHTTSDGTMFAPLEQFRDETFCEEYGRFSITTPERELLAEIIGVCLVSESEPYPESFETVEERTAFLNWVQAHSIVNTQKEVDEDTPLCILSTCAYDFEDARLAVICKLDEQSIGGTL